MEDNFKARAYQIDLFETAVKENSIIYLPTGAGKTFIAVMLIKELSKDVRRPYNEGKKHIVYIVCTVPLVTQQRDYIARLTGLICRGISGDSGVDFWSQTEWEEMLKKDQVLVMTSQVLVDALAHGFICLNNIRLLVLDECHRAVHDHPMRQIMQYFEDCPIKEQPRVLGLSATLLNSNTSLNKVHLMIKSLEVTLHAKIATVDSMEEIQGYYPIPKQLIVRFSLYDASDVQHRVYNIVDETCNILNQLVYKSPLINSLSSMEFRPKPVTKKLMAIVTDIKDQIATTGIYGASKAILFHLIRLECLKRDTDHLKAVDILEYVITQVIKCRKLIEDSMKSNTELEKINKYTSNQLQKTFILLKDFYNKKYGDQEFCCIIFAKTRFTVKTLHSVLKSLAEYDKEFKFLKPDFVVGYSNNPYKSCTEKMCITKWNKEALLRFRNGLSNCMIATDIIDEGVDIPLCTLIIRFNLPNDLRSYIQSKGRARFASSYYVLLLLENEMDYLNRLEQFQTVEKYLQEVLIKQNSNREKPTENEITNELYKRNIEPYHVTNENGDVCTLTEQLVVSLVNRYCTSLLKSKFVHLTPTWVLNKTASNDKTFYQVSLKLPSVSPIKHVVVGDWMTTINSAKRSAAMKMCIELHKCGELSDKFLPNSMYPVELNSTHLFPNWINEDKSANSNLIGSYKNKRHYKLQFPSALYGAFPLPKKLLYLHLLHITPKNSPPLDDNRDMVFYNLLNNSEGFAILSTKQMPKIPSFSIFMNIYELNVVVKVNYRTTILSSKEIDDAKIFHTLMFSQIVPTIKSFMLFDNDNFDNCFLIVPVDDKWEINWSVIMQYNCIKRIEPPVPSHLKNSDYELALLIPVYRAADVYVVTQICDDLTPNSCFPTENFYSYAHYYKEKHGLIINDLKQPMLEVKAISRNINYIRPRGMSFESRKRKHAEQSKEFKEHLVPELCTRIDFPAVYWLKTTLLPSILHRVSQLLVAEDLRYTIAIETKLGCVSTDIEWPPLTLTDNKKEESLDPLPDITTDVESLDDLQSETTLSGPEIDVLNVETSHYPWLKDQEPLDLHRNVNEVQLIDIEYYCQFIKGTHDEKSDMVQESKVNFTNRQVVSVPALKILLLKDRQNIDPIPILYALTSKIGNDAFNLERLEILGDSYLKFIVSLFLYTTFPNYREGVLTSLKGKLIGNTNLCYCGMKKNIPGRMKVDDFEALSNFITPAYTVDRDLQKLLLDIKVSPNVLYEVQIPNEEQFSGCMSDVTKSLIQEKVQSWEATGSQTGLEHYLGIQTVNDKTVADCVEALIGAYITTVGIENTVILLKWFEILPNTTDLHALLIDIPKDVETTVEDIDQFMPWASDIETRLGYTFKNRVFLLQAFTHSSYTANNITECYQRLEFLGDAILDFLITCYIYESCGNLSPGALTDLRSALVNNITFACLSVRYALHTALLAYAPNLFDAINSFVKFQEEKGHVMDDELLWILLEEDECNLAEHVDVPKVLGDLFESVIGAIYLDSGKNLIKTWEIIYSLMYNEIDKFSKNTPKQPIRVLYETQGAQPQFLKASIIEHTSSVMVPLKVNVAGKTKVFYGVGANKKHAKCAAAKQALKSLLCR